ncbi:MAG TPA: hypothetical protein VMI54_05915 [Polyangiaceae bacterium]|nr:hypothetical protein [Polyangiaceae bacterium]
MTRTRLLVRSLGLLAVFLGGAAAASCGGSDKQSPAPASGGSAGMSMKPASISCGDATCDALTLPFPPNYAAPCCTEDDACGIDASPLEAYGAMFTNTCQALHQPGAADPSCPVSPPISVTIGASTQPLMLTFPGCCHTDTNTCGYNLDKLGDLIPLGFGCVDSMPFLDGGTPSPCGSGGAAGAAN